MKKSVIALIVVIVIVVAGGLLLATRKSGEKTTSSSNMHTSTSQSSTTSASTNSVTIENFAFSPANITVKKGTTVTWTNKDGATHDVTENDGQTGPNSGPLANGKSYSFTYTTAGTFKYHCSIHPDMTGIVTVTE